MKKIAIILALSLVAFSSAQAQSSFRGTTSNPTNAITSVTTDTMTYVVQSNSIAHLIQIKKEVGTTVTGTAIIQSSIDGGTTYFNTDTITIASGASKAYYVQKNYPVWNKYRIITIGGGTGTGTLSGKIRGIQVQP